jgi:ABC-type polysaccharide/polyol phosphate transport system ATPase subunit
MEIIRLNQVSLWRRTQEEYTYDLKKTIFSLLEGKYRQPARKLVLDRIELSVQAGEKLGIIGSNGSGKSTLLKVICGILQPTQGSAEVIGNIAPLIELGAGFDLEMTVRDNIIFNGVLLGYPKADMIERTASILDFAELQDYALVPVKALSSGMTARLGFAIATDVQPDILILDEVLSVGDESFKSKSRQRINQFWEAHATVLVVSHDLNFIRQSCERVVWINKGQVTFMGSASDTIDQYLSSVKLYE